MQFWASRKSTRPPRLAATLLLTSLLILTGCALPTLTWPPATPPASPDGGPPIRAYVCSEIRIVPWHGGKIDPAGNDALTQKDVQDALAQGSGWEDQVRRLAGDTTSTIAAIKLNNAVLHALCDSPKQTPLTPPVA